MREYDSYLRIKSTKPKNKKLCGERNQVVLVLFCIIVLPIGRQLKTRQVIIMESSKNARFVRNKENFNKKNFLIKVFL